MSGRFEDLIIVRHYVDWALYCRVIDSDVSKTKESVSNRFSCLRKIGGAAGEPPPGSEKPDTCFLQAQSRVCLERTSLSRPQSLPPQAQLFSDGSRANLTVLAAVNVGAGADCGDLSLTVASLD